MKADRNLRRLLREAGMEGAALALSNVEGLSAPSSGHGGNGVPPSKYWLVRGLAVALVLIAGIAVMTGCSKRGEPSKASVSVMHPKYHCPMHPEIISDKPGECPICGMDLVPIDAVPAGGATTSAIPGLASVTITPELRQRMGLTVGVVEQRAMTRIIRTPARMIADETRQFRVTTKVDGYVDTLAVSVMGQTVKKGDPLLTIYSPQLVSSQQEFILAVQSGIKMAVDAARQRLQFWDISDAQITALEQTGKIEKFLTLYAPASGVVTEKTVLAGQKISPGESLMVVTDLSRIWAEADLAESDLPFVRIGMPIELTLPYWPGKSVKGVVSFVSPALDPATHTVKVRMDVANVDLVLKLEMYADASLAFPMGNQIVVPETAVMRTGERSYVFRDAGDGKLIPVEIQVGVRNDGLYQVLSGVVVGDRVVTSANFLVDSESSIRAIIDSRGHDGK